MADNHAYVPAPGIIVPIINHLKNSFPATINADTLRKLGFAPKNESYVLNVLRTLGLLDESGKKTDTAAKIFSIQDDAAFSKAFGEIVKKSYKDLFELQGDKSWNLDTNALITFFRQSDHTSAITGKRQAATFQILAAFSGHGDVPRSKSSTQKKNKESDVKKPERKKIVSLINKDKKQDINQKDPKGSMGLTVRIEINLPADGDQETYDRIFKSIKENLLNV